MKLHYIIIALLLIFRFISTAQATIVENEDYIVLDHPVKQKNSAIVVVEFFSYGCPYAYKLEPAIQKWLAQKPKDVIFQRIPVKSKSKRSWLAYAKTYYALQQLSHKRAEKLTPLIFEAVHKHNQRLYDTDTFLAWASKHGVNQDSLAKALNSQAAINKRLQDGENLGAQYGVTGVPIIFVDGRYRVIYGRNTPIHNIAEIIDQLIDKARLERTAKRKYKR